jgi:hypothetical protein
LFSYDVTPLTLTLSHQGRGKKDEIKNSKTTKNYSSKLKIAFSQFPVSFKLLFSILNFEL